MSLGKKIKNYLISKIILITYRILPQVFYSNIFKTHLVKDISESYPHHPFLPVITPAFLRRFFQYHRNFQKKFVESFFLKGVIENEQKRNQAIAQGLPSLATLLISPTMRCNLRCVGCYAQNYEKKDDLPLEIFNRVIEEAKELGVAFFTILGGEPFIYPGLFDVFRKHADTFFQVYTNGTLINDEVAQKLAALGNVFPQISIEGFERETDERRGKGTFRKVIKAMETLKEIGFPFGYSVCVTKRNAEEVVSDEFVDLMIEKGALVGWYFLYMPVWGDKNTELMPTPEQRNYLRLRRDYIRDTKPIFIIDFWNDAPYVGGCIAARSYSHVTNFGDVEPCIFTHFAQGNVKETPLKEVLKCSFFREIRSRQPYHPNLLMPCMLIDHPKVIRELYQLCHPYPTHPGAQTLIEELKEDIDEYSSKLHQIYNEIWDLRGDNGVEDATKSKGL